MKKFLLLFALFANFFVTVAFWWHTSGLLITSGESSSILIGLGRLVGLLGELGILTQLVLVGRIRFVERSFGMNKLNNLHRKIGYTWGTLIILHPLLLTIGYAQSNGVSLTAQFIDFFQHWEDVWKAIVGLGLMYIIIAISISIIRKKLKYETWYFTHLFIYVAIALFFGHQVNTADAVNKIFYYYWYALNFIVFGFVLLYRFLRPIYLAFKYQFKIEKVVSENNTVTSVHITGKNLETFVYEAGQYMHANFLARGLWFTHPFSFSTAPNGKELRLSIKKNGDFTSKIEQLQPGTRVLIDGPFGIFTERFAVTKKFLFIAGGIGITPIYALIESMAPKNRDMILLYSNKYKSEALFFHTLSHWGVKSHYIFSGEEERGYEFGRIDKEKIMRLAPDFKDRDIYICGPVAMMDELVALFIELNVPRKQLHFERFGY